MPTTQSPRIALVELLPRSAHLGKFHIIDLPPIYVPVVMRVDRFISRVCCARRREPEPEAAHAGVRWAPTAL